MKDIYSLEVRLSKQEDGLWRAEIPSLQGCFVDGATVKEVMKDIQAVAAMFLDTRLERGETPSSLGAVEEANIKLRLPVVISEHWFRRIKQKSSGTPKKQSATQIKA